jgi:uncharacterized protein
VKRAIASAVVSAFACACVVLAGVVLAGGLLASMAPAAAQDTGLDGSFITPYPENDVYRVQIVGDWLGEGLLGGLQQAFNANPGGAQIYPKRYKLSGLRRQRAIDGVEKDFANDPSHIAVVMLGVDDRYSLSSKSLSSGNEKWRAEYGARVDQLMKTLKKGGRAVYWIGLPNMRRWRDNERAKIMNEVFRERAYLNGVRYIDAYASFLDEGGGYSDYGPDVTGKVQRLRYRDGVHFTDAGYRKLAHFVERDLKRDMAQARRERSVPLAGTPAEQVLVNPDRAKLKSEAARAQGADKAAKKKAGVTAPAVIGARDLKAEAGKVDVKTVGPGGAEQVVTMEIVRPAVPAAVVALMTRKQSADRAAQMGDVLVDQIPGGLTVMSSIVPPRGAGSRRRLSPTQTPYYRVFERGERLVPKPGRADDFAWPRPQQTAVVDTGSNADPSVPPLPVQSP